MNKRTVLSTFTLLVLLAGLVSGVLQSLIVPHQASAAPGDALGEAWVARYNTPREEEDKAEAIAIDAAGNVYVAGFSEGDDTGRDYATIKYDIYGNQLWVARYNGPGNGLDMAAAIIVDDSGNVYVTGRSAGIGTSWDYATIGYDGEGNELWLARYNGPGNGVDAPSAIGMDPSGSIYVTGESMGSGTYLDYATVKYQGDNGTELWVARHNLSPVNDVESAAAIAVDGSGDVYVTGYGVGFGTLEDYVTVKYQSDSGAELWVARYNASFGSPDYGSDEATAITVDSFGDVYVTGYSMGAGFFGSADYATVKYQSDNGTELWVARYNGPTLLGDGWDQPTAIAVDNDENPNVYVTGYSTGDGTSYDWATLKYDSDGNQVWEARNTGTGGSGGDRALSMDVDDLGNVYVTGNSVVSGAYSDFVTVKYNSDGSKAWDWGYSGTEDGPDSGTAVVVDASGNVCVTGWIAASTPYNAYETDYATMKLDADGVPLWVSRYDYVKGCSELPYDVAVDALGNVYVTGYSGFGSTPGGTAYVGDYDYATVKYDSSGSQLWVATYNGPGNDCDYATAIAVDASGNVYVTGDSVGAGGDSDYATIKYDSSGNELWVARYNGPGNDSDHPTDIAVDSSGNVCVTGESVGAGSDYDYATVEYDGSGNELWVARYDGPGSDWDWAMAMAVDVSGNVCVTGLSVGAAEDYATIKYDSSGNELWVARYNNGPGISSDTAVAIAVDTSGNVCVTGETLSVFGDQDYVTVEYDSSGNQLWATTYNGPGNGPERPAAIAVDTSGNVYVTGRSYVGAGGYYDYYDYATVKYDSSGNQLWVATYNGPGNYSDYPADIAVDSSGYVYVTGMSLGAGGSYDYATIEYDSSGNQLWVGTYDGGSGQDAATAMAIDDWGSVYVTGYISSGTPYNAWETDFATIKYASTALIVSVNPSEVPTPSNAQSIPLQDIPLQDIPLQDIPLQDIPFQDIALGTTPLQDIPLQDIPLQDIDWAQRLAGTSLEGTPLQDITLGDLLLAGVPLQDITLADIFLAGIPLQDIVLGSAPLQDIPLQDIPLQDISWQSILLGTPLQDIPLQDISLRDLMLASIPLQDIPLQDIDILGSALRYVPLQDIPLQDITWESILMGTPLQDIPLQDITLGDLVQPNISIPLQDITLLNVLLSRVPLQDIPLQDIPLQDINILGTPLQDIPLQDIPLQDITWNQLFSGTAWEGANLATTTLRDLAMVLVPLQDITLADVPLQYIPLQDIPLQDIHIVGTPLQHIPLQDIPLQDITWASILLGTPLQDIPLQDITLGDLALAGIPLQDISLGDIVLAGVPLQDIPLQDIPILGTPLQDIPLQDIPLQDINWESILLGTPLQYIPLQDITLGDLALAGIPLQDITLWEALTALIPLQDIPWESVPLQDIPLQDSFTSQNAVTYTITLSNYKGTDALDVYITHTLPEGFRYVAGSTSGVTTADPSIAGQDLTWGPFTVAADTRLLLQFEATAGVSLGTHFSSVSATSSNVEVPPAQDVAPVTVVDTFEPNNSWDQAQEISPDQLYISYISSGNDVDWYKIPVPVIRGTMVTVYISHLPADYDLTLFAGIESLPTDIPLQDIPLQDIPLQDIPLQDIPLQDIPLQDIPLQDIPLQDIPLQDIPLQDIPLQDISIERGTTDEVTGDKVFNETGYYYILVSGYNGAHSSQPYTLRIKVTPPPDISALSRSLPSVGPAGTAYEPWPTDTETLIVTNEQRLGQYYGIERVQALRASLETFADNSTVKGMIVPVEQSAEVCAAYAAWDQNAGDPEAANAVAAQIRQEINRLLSTRPTVKYVVIVGSDEIVPFRRVPDEVYLSNESTYAARAHIQPSALYYALLHGFILTDDYYVDTAPVPWMGRELYVPDYAIGRLVETPEEIGSMLSAFTSNQGRLTVTEALVSGYDFLSDGANSIASVLQGHYIAVSDLISENWTAQDLVDQLLASPDLDSINAHCNHWQIGPAAGSPLQSDQILASYVGGKLVFSMGCHAGLNVADNVSEPGVWSLDLAQALAGSGAWFVGNTGYGYGDSDIVALSEELMSNFAESLVSADSVAVGQALLDAKQNYFLNMGSYGAFDEKIMIESTLYGLPMYQVVSVPSTPPATGQPDVTLDIQVNLLGEASGSISEQVPLFLNTSPDSSQFFSAWAEGGDCQFTPYRPIQPKTSLDISYAGQVARGVVFTGGTYQEYDAFDPVIARPVDVQSLYEPQFINEAWYPSKLQTIMSLDSLGTLQQNLVVMPGQFVTTSADTNVTGTERLYTSLSYDIYYSASTDYQPPTIRLVEATGSRSGDSDVFAAHFSVTVGDDEGVSKVYVTWTYHSGDSPWWETIPLTYDATSGTWRGELPTVTGGQIDYLVQAVDNAGNVGGSTCKGLYFTSFPPIVSVNLDAGTVNEGETLQGCGAFTDQGSTQWSATVDYGDGSGIQPLALASDNTFALNHIYADEGQYDILVMVKDGEGGVGSLGQTVTIVNAAPVVTSVTSDPVPIGTSMTVAAEFTDSGILDSHTAVWQWGDGTPDTPGVVVETNGSGSVGGTHNYTGVGVYAVTLTVTDNDGASGQFVVYAAVYDASAGFVTGAGLIDSPAGAYAADPSSAGKASFGFVSKYQKGTSVPTGRTSFRFHAADFTFESTDYQWMVIAGARVQYKGSGTVNGVAGYGFILTAIDGQISGGGGVDRFRIKVWNKATGNIVYDNQIGAADNAAPATAISAGNIVIHK